MAICDIEEEAAQRFWDNVSPDELSLLDDDPATR